MQHRPPVIVGTRGLEIRIDGSARRLVLNAPHGQQPVKMTAEIEAFLAPFPERTELQCVCVLPDGETNNIRNYLVVRIDGPDRILTRSPLEVPLEWAPDNRALALARAGAHLDAGDEATATPFLRRAFELGAPNAHLELARLSAAGQAELAAPFARWSEEQKVLLAAAEHRRIRDELHRAIMRGPQGERTSFAGRNFDGEALAGRDLSNLDFPGASLRGVNLSQSQLHGVDFSSADLTGADLRDADLTGAFLNQADLTDARLSGAWFDGVELRGAKLPPRWQELTRIHEIGLRPFDREDLVAAVRRALVEDDRAAAIAAVRRERYDHADALVAHLAAHPEVRSLAELRTAALPPTLALRVMEMTESHSLGDVATALAGFAREDLATCRAKGLRWTVQRGLTGRGSPATSLLLAIERHGHGEAIDLVKRMSGYPQEVLLACQRVDEGKLVTAAEALSWALHEDFDRVARLLWCLREALAAG